MSDSGNLSVSLGDAGQAIAGTPFAAYRVDVQRATVGDEFGRSDATWLLIATAARRLSQRPPAQRASVGRTMSRALATAIGRGGSRSPAKRLINALGRLGNPARRDDLFEAVRECAEEMELAGALNVAATCLHSILAAFPRAHALHRGRALAALARISRQLGDLAAAEELLAEVEVLGTQKRLPELRALAHFGAGGLALMRGNHPGARERFTSALRDATSANADELAGRIHRGLMITEATVGNTQSALEHGGIALRLARKDVESRAELLANLAGLCAVLSYYDAALSGYAAAATSARTDRIRLPALGGAALSAARLGKRQLVEHAALAIERMLQSNAPPYESAQALLDLAQAWHVLGLDERSEQYRARAQRITSAHSFHELHYRADATQDKPRLSKRSEAVVRRLEALPWREDDLAAGVGRMLSDTKG